VQVIVEVGIDVGLSSAVNQGDWCAAVAAGGASGGVGRSIREAQESNTMRKALKSGRAFVGNGHQGARRLSLFQCLVPNRTGKSPYRGGWTNCR
jgi:hypothetical protein